MTLSLLFCNRFRAISLLVLLGSSLLAQGQSNATPAIRYVRTNGPNNNPASATTWATSTTNLQGAIEASAPGDQVWVAQGTYKPGGTANTDRNLSFAMRNGVSILGGFADSGTPTLAQRNPGNFTAVLSGDIGTIGSNGDNVYHVVNNGGLDATAVLDGFIIRDGNADNNNGGGRNNGGGMYNNGSSPTVINCSFLSNSAVYGGGMFNQGGSPTLINCSFLNNSGFYGGGMNNSQSSPGLTNCSLLSNSASAGGGIFNFNSSPSLTNCVLYGNGGANTFSNGNSSTSVRYSLLETTVTKYTDGGNNLTTSISPFISSTDALLNGCSPAINTGLNSANATTTDLAGNPRFFNNGTGTPAAGTPDRIDMGSYEYQAAPTTIITTAPGTSTATLGQVFSQPFTATGGAAPYSYSLASGSLPTGLSLATTGVLSGTPTQSGSFTITVLGRDASGCSGISAAYVLTVSEPVSVMLTGLAATPNAVCTGSVATFTATVGNVTGSYSYTLTNGLSAPLTGSASGTLFSQSIPAGGTGTQRFTLTVTANGQSASGETPLTVNPLPVASLTNNGPLSCAQSSVTLTANGAAGAPGSSYTFASGSGVLGTPGPVNTLVVSSAGTYSVTVASASGCVSTTSTIVTADQTAPSVSITTNPSGTPTALTITQGQSATLTAQVSGDTPPFTYTWSTGANTPSIIVSTAGPYSVTGTAGNGCSATASLTFTVTPVVSGPFALTGVTTLDCSPTLPNRFTLSFTPRYQGLDGSPMSFSVTNELLPTTSPGPYTLQLYSDNPVITLSATQSGSDTEARFIYNWLAACQTAEGPNTPPRLVTPLSSQTATVGQGFAYVVPAGTFTDNETPLTLTLSAQGVPQGLSFTGTTLTGTPSTTVGSPYSVSLTATDPGGLSVTTLIPLVILPASTPVEPGSPFSITGVTTLSCTPVGDRINLSFAPRYAGLNGQAVSFEVVNEQLPTSNPAPYSLSLYRDNPTITLRAIQSGSAGAATFRYDWLAACASQGQDNTPPRINRPIDNQTATVGVGYSLNLANTFADQETPNQLSLSVTGLPVGLNLVGSTISGTPSVSGVSTVTLTATDPGSLSTSTSFQLTVSPASSTTVSTPTSPFSITGVTTVSCEVISAGQRRVTFTPRYDGLNGQPVSFSVVNEKLPTTEPGPYTLNLYTDNPLINLSARQGSATSTYAYNWLTACSSGARQASAEAGTGLRVVVLGNPILDNQVKLEVRGAGGQPLRLSLTNLQGQSVSERLVESAGAIEHQTIGLGSQPSGVLLLRVSTATQHQILKVIKP